MLLHTLDPVWYSILRDLAHSEYYSSQQCVVIDGMIWHVILCGLFLAWKGLSITYLNVCQTWIYYTASHCQNSFDYLYVWGPASFGLQLFIRYTMRVITSDHMSNGNNWIWDNNDIPKYAWMYTLRCYLAMHGYRCTYLLKLREYFVWIFSSSRVTYQESEICEHYDLWLPHISIFNVR